MSDISPWFEPGSGWYRLGNWAPGTPADLDAKAKAAYRCVVFRMRRQGGGKLTASEVAAAEPVAGGIVCMDWGNHPHWHAELLALPGLKKQLLHMHQVKLVRMRGGFRQYHGTEYDEKALSSWPQTWFCAPNAEAGMGVLEKMAASV